MAFLNVTLSYRFLFLGHMIYSGGELIEGSLGQEVLGDTGAAGRRGDGLGKVVGDTAGPSAEGSGVPVEIVGDRGEKTGSLQQCRWSSPLSSRSSDSENAGWVQKRGLHWS